MISKVSFIKTVFLLTAILLATWLFSSIDATPHRSSVHARVDNVSVETTENGTNRLLVQGASLEIIQKAWLSPDQDNSNRILHTLELNEHMRPIAIEGNIAVAPNRRSGLHIIEINKSNGTKLIHTEPFSPIPTGVALLKDRLYVNTVEDGLWIYDLSNPRRPVHMSTINAAGAGGQITFVGDHAYIAGGKDGVFCVDVSNAEVPRVIHHFAHEYFVWDIKIHNDHAYVATANSGVRIFHLQPGSMPDQVGHIQLEAGLKSLAIRDTLLAVGHYTKGLGLYKIDVPESPIKISQTQNFLSLRNSLFYQDYLLITSSSGLSAIDLSNPETPHHIGTINIPQGLGQITACEDKQVAIATNTTRVISLDLSSLNTLNKKKYLYLNRTSQITTMGGTLYASSRNELSSIKLTEELPSRTTVIKLPGQIKTITADHERLYAATKGNKLYSIRVSHEGKGSIVWEKELDSAAVELFAGDGWVGVVNGLNLSLFPSNQESSIVPGQQSYTLPSSILSVVGFREHIFIASRDNGIWSLTPDHLGQMKLVQAYAPAWPQSQFEKQMDLQIYKNRLLVANNDPGMSIFKIKPKTGMLELKQEVDLDFQATRIHRQGDLLCITNPTQNIRLFQFMPDGELHYLSAIPGTFGLKDFHIMEERLGYIDKVGHCGVLPLPQSLPLVQTAKNFWELPLPYTMKPGDYLLQFQPATDIRTESISAFFSHKKAQHQ